MVHINEFQIFVYSFFIKVQGFFGLMSLGLFFIGLILRRLKVKNIYLFEFVYFGGGGMKPHLKFQNFL